MSSKLSFASIPAPKRCALELKIEEDSISNTSDIEMATVLLKYTHNKSAYNLNAERKEKVSARRNFDLYARELVGQPDPASQEVDLPWSLCRTPSSVKHDVNTGPIELVNATIQHRLPVFPFSRREGTMIRQSLARSALRTSWQSCNASRTFATSSRRQAEVQLTIGKKHWVCGFYGRTRG